VATQFGSRLALIAFATATLRGLLAGADFEGTIQSALLAGLVFFVLGLVCGELARLVVEEQVEAEFEQMLSAPSERALAKSPATQQEQVQRR
jgi:hypothetical protein